MYGMTDMSTNVFPAHPDATPGTVHYSSADVYNSSDHFTQQDADLYNSSDHFTQQDITGHYDASRKFLYYAYGITGTTVAVLGLVGNILSTIVLSHPRMRSATSCYLVALAIYDSLVLITLLLFFALPVLNETYLDNYPYIQPYAYPLALTAQTCSIYTTVGFTVERYIAVCHPLHAATWCTLPRARKSILLILLCAVVYNIPRLFEYSTVLKIDPANETYPVFEKTELGEHGLFQQTYRLYLHLIVMMLVPFSLLALLNALLIGAVRRSTRTARGQTASRRAARENNLTVMLIVVVAVFLVCEVPSIVDNVIAVVLSEQTIYSTPSLIKFEAISNVFVVMNSAVNFYLYCCFGNKFRSIFVTLLCKCDWRGGGGGARRAYRDTTSSLMRYGNSFKADYSIRRNGYAAMTTQEKQRHGGLQVKPAIVLDSMTSGDDKLPRPSLDATSGLSDVYV